MSWKFFLYDWGGLNIALFQAINMSTPAALEPLASFFNLVIGNYWTAPLMLLAMWGWSKSAPDPTRADAIGTDSESLAWPLRWHFSSPPS